MSKGKDAGIGEICTSKPTWFGSRSAMLMLHQMILFEIGQKLDQLLYLLAICKNRNLVKLLILLVTLVILNSCVYFHDVILILCASFVL